MDWIKLLNNNRLRQSARVSIDDARNDFESDFGRIIFSPAIRRMHDKTQVFPLTADDNIHSRLTHSLEVMSISYSLGVQLCESKILKERLEKDTYSLFREIPIILKNCSLVHDIGNPPFGHFGETVIQNYFDEFFKNDTGLKKYSLKIDADNIPEFIHFDGNAQGLRILTKLQYLNDIYGLNLTYATLAAYIKYPNYSKIDKSRLESKKIGVYQSEKVFFDKIVDECGLIINGQVTRHPLCYLMEAADSICYFIMDIEDGYNKKIFDLEYLYKRLKDIPSIRSKIENIFIDANFKYRNDTTKMVNFRILIIQTLVSLAISNFVKNLDGIENGTYNQELLYDDNDNLARKLQDLTVDKIFKYREIVSLELTGHSVITGLLNYYIDLVFHKEKKYREKASCLISNSIIQVAIEENINQIYAKRFQQIANENKRDEKSIEFNYLYNSFIELDNKRKEANSTSKQNDVESSFRKANWELRQSVVPNLDDLDDYYKLRIIVDFITGMTDQYALNHYQKISGQKIS